MLNIVKFKFNLAATGILWATSIFATQMAIADENPFRMTELSSGYVVAEGHGKGHGKCHGKRHKMKMMDSDGDGSVSKEEFMAHAEKKFSKKDKNGDGVLSAEEMKKMKKHGQHKSDS